MVVGDEPLVAFIVIWGAIEYLDKQGNVVKRASPASALETYRAHCEATGADMAPRFERERPASHAAG
jgi:hypothetical protein